MKNKDDLEMRDDESFADYLKRFYHLAPDVEIISVDDFDHVRWILTVKDKNGNITQINTYIEGYDADAERQKRYKKVYESGGTE